MDDAGAICQVSGTEVLFDPVDRNTAPDMPAFADVNELSLAHDVRESGTRRINQPTFYPQSTQNEIKHP